LIALFSALLGSVFGIMSAVGGVMEFTEEKLQARARKKLHQNKLKQCVNTLSRHAAFSFTRPPPTSPTNLRARVFAETNSRYGNREFLVLEQRAELSGEGIVEE
jgi:hypothetical protein